MALTSQITTSLLQVDGRLTEGGVIEIVPGARLLLDVGVENVEPGALLDEIATAVAEAQAARDAAVDVSGISTSDAVIANRIETPGTATQTALSATFATQRAAGPVIRAIRTAVNRVKAAPTPSTYQSFVTPYGGTNEVVHPAVVYIPGGWNGYAYWMAITPYQGGDNQKENPCIYASHDGETWVIPAGGSNPVVPVEAGAYNSDNHLVLVGDTMYLFWRAVYAGTETIWYRTSTNGTSWTARVESLTSTHAVRRPVSPAILHEGGLWTMFAIDANTPTKLLRFVSSTPVFSAAAPTVCTITAPEGGREWWHLDVARWGRELHMVVSDGTSGTNGMTGALWFAVSVDNGLNWTVANSPLFPRRDTFYPKWDRATYRSALVPSVVDGIEGYDLWMGSSSPEWRVGRTRLNLSGHADATSGEVHGIQAIESVNILLASRGIAPYTAGDTFSRPDSASTMGNADSGQAWTIGSGTWGIASGKGGLASATVNSRAWIESGLADAVVEVDLSGIVANTDPWWIILRLTDASNYIRLGVNTTGSLLMQNIVAGVVTQIGSYGTRTPNARWRVVLSGGTLTVFQNGERIGTATTTITSGTKYGLQVSTVAPRMDNFTVRALVNGA